jgi:hypothetical protein
VTPLSTGGQRVIGASFAMAKKGVFENSAKTPRPGFPPGLFFCSMIPKSGDRFSEEIMLQKKA